MDFMPLFEGELRYTSLTALSYQPGGQIYGTMEGEVSGDRLSGHFQLTNLATMRPDNVNCPTLRGLLTTDDGAQAYVELDGVANLRPSDEARVFVTSLSFRTGDARYAWLNTAMGVVEGVLDVVTAGGTAKLRAYTCDPTI